jgi:hypothetical protein
MTPETISPHREPAPPPPAPDPKVRRVRLIDAVLSGALRLGVAPPSTAPRR